MDESNGTQRSSISQANTLEGIAEFWDNHSLDDYWDQTHEVEFEVRAERKRRVTLETQVYDKLEEQAQVHGLQPDKLVNLWLTERLALEVAA